MVWDNDNNQSCNNECNNENDQSEEWMENPSIYNKILGYSRIVSNNKILLTPF